MNKLFYILLLLMIISHAYAIESQAEPVSRQKTENGAQETSAPMPGAKPNAAPAPEAPQDKTSQGQGQEMIDLETAYKHEYAFLEAQKRELSERLKNYQASANREEQELSKKINTLERDSVTRSAQIDQLNAQLAEAERNEAAVSERSDALDITYSQAEATLNSHDVEIPPSIKDAQDNDLVKVGYVFKQALSLLENLGAVQSRSGRFFLENGKQTQGNIIHLGNIAAYGISEQGSGSLVPAGGGDFKIWKASNADIAKALGNNQQPEILNLFLFESRTNAIDETPEKTIIGVINSGGVIGWVIVALGTFALLLILIRASLLYSNSANTASQSEKVVSHVAAGDLDEARKSCEAGSSAITRVLSASLRHLKDDRDHMENIVHEAILHESGPLDRFGSAILVIASVSPLLGLLGTVTGMISTFDVITEFGTGDPKLLSGGISIALVTTELGLVVAIPALLLGSLLSAWARNIKRDIEHAALRITNAFLSGESNSEPKRAESNIGRDIGGDNNLVVNNQVS